MEEFTVLHELYVKKCEDISITMVDLDWLKGRLEKKEFLMLEEAVSLCIIQNHEELFKSGFYCALELFKEKQGRALL